MRNCLTFLVLISMALTTSASAAGEPFRITRLRCESRDVPMGIDTTHPRLSWTLASDERGQRQSAYQIQVTSSAGRFDTPDLWDSGKVSSDESASIAYAGKPLNSLATCAWRVRVWDVNDHPSSWTDGPAWTMGLLAPSDWQAKWIDRGNGPAATQPTTPMPRFSKTFRAAQPVKRALIAICGLGQFDLRINGKPARDDFLQPGWTDYRKTCLYVLYDVTPLLQRDQNVVSVTLGNGMYNCVGGRYTKFKASFGPPKLIAQLRLDYADGTSQTIGTDSSWKTGDSSTTFSSIYGGEDVDARISSDESASSSAHETDGPGGTLACASKSALPIQIDHVLTPVKITEPRPGVFVYDMGQNCAQVPQLRVSGPAGTKVVLEPSELLHPDGMIAPQSTGAKLGGVHSTYTLRGGGGVETFEPRFYYAGCRYWQVTGAIPKDSAGADDPTKAVVQELRGQFVTSTSPIAGEFECSSEMFNRTRTLIRWAMRSNMMSVLTDCPHRERLGWLEQDHLVGPSITYNFDVQALLGKICNDMAEAQHDDGLMPDIAPEYVKFKGGFLDSPEWGSACVLVPWQAYQSYGDEQVLRDHLDTMTRYVEYLNRQSKEHILDFGLGDWYDLGPKPPGIAQLTPKALTATAFFYRDASLVAQIAKLLGRAEDATKYASLAGEICEAFNRAFYDAAHHRYATGSQTGDALPLVFGMVPETDRAAVLDDLVSDIRQRDNGLTAGDVGYRYVLRALADGGRSDVIFDMNSRDDRPGYGYILKKGATALTEAWDARANSQDHFMLGHIMEWFYSDLAGIQQAPDSVGWKKIIIKPTPVGDVTWAKAKYDSVRGPIVSDWRVDGGAFKLSVSIPPGTAAVVLLPASASGSLTEDGKAIGGSPYVRSLPKQGDRNAIEIDSGSYSFVAGN